jgi:hypothetical protein
MSRSHQALLALLAAGGLLAAAFAPAAGAGPPERFEILNDTRQPVEGLYFQSPAEGDWQEDLLGDEILPAGGWTEAPLNPAHGCRYDLRAVLADGAMVVAYNVDVCLKPRFKLSKGHLTRQRTGNRAADPEPGMAPGGYAIQATADETGEPSPSMEAGGAAPPPISRGLPICPGDPRCKRKK